MFRLLEIAEAWISSENPKPEQKEKAEHRIKICNTCPEKKYNKMFDTYLCGVCNCPISKKIFIKDKKECPKNKWEI